MTAPLYSTTFLLLLGRCFGVFGVDNPKPDKEIYYNAADPLGISCVYNQSMTAFHQEYVSGSSNFSATLVERLNNGKPLSLYVDGVLSDPRATGSTFNLAKEWAKVSDTNVCYLTYAYKSIPESRLKILFASQEMVKSKRSLHSAQLASNLILNIRDHCVKSGSFGCWVYMSKITVVGYSLGAHIASQICTNLYKNSGQKVGKLIGLDPAGVWLISNRYDHAFINRGDATYVQIIHTDVVFFGTTFPCGDIDIYIQDIPLGYTRKHGFGPYLQMATSMKKLLLIAEKEGSGQMIQIDENSQQNNTALKENEVIVGVYSELEESKRGQKFYFSMKNRSDMLRSSIADFVGMHMPASWL